VAPAPVLDPLTLATWKREIVETCLAELRQRQGARDER
jgi:hypothetical protein